jgi:8-oxo-dGTP pyrophosphatase MutT (NUDIX family)
MFHRRLHPASYGSVTDREQLERIFVLLRFAGRLLFRLFITVKALIAPTAFGVTGTVLDGAGRVLLVRHRYMPGWQLPGGGVDRGEPPELAVMRELREDVGLIGGEAAFLGLYTRPAGWAATLRRLAELQGAPVSPYW